MKIFFFNQAIQIILFPSLGFCHIASRPFAGFRRVVYLSMSTALSAFPLAAALVATVMVTRLAIDMGITQKRLLGIAIGTICIAAVPVSLYILYRKPRVMIQKLSTFTCLLNII